MDSLSEFGKIAEFIRHPLVLVGFVVMLVFSIHKLILKAKLLKELNQQQSSFVVVLLLRYGLWLGVLIALLVFGLQFYQTYVDKEIKKETKAAEIESIKKTVERLELDKQAKDKQLQAKDKQLQVKDEQLNKALTLAVTSIKTGEGLNATASEREMAYAALQKGDVSLAKQLFEKTAKQGEQNAKQTAEAYRNLGALAFLDNTEQSLQAYQRSTQLDPDNANGWNQLGHLFLRIGELDQAIAAYQQGLELGKKHQHQHLISISYGNLGEIYRTQGE